MNWKPFTHSFNLVLTINYENISEFGYLHLFVFSKYLLVSIESILKNSEICFKILL